MHPLHGLDDEEALDHVVSQRYVVSAKSGILVAQLRISPRPPRIPRTVLGSKRRSDNRRKPFDDS